MSLEIKIVNPLNYAGWDELVLSTQDYSFFHSSAWAKVLYESYKYRPLYFTIIDKNELFVLIPFMEIKSLLTGNRGISLPFSDYCETIINVTIPKPELINFINNYSKKADWKYFELRGGKIFDKDIPHYKYFYRHHLSLSLTEKQIFSNFRKGTKSTIRRAIKEGVEIKICNSLESLKKFYQLNCITRKKHGLPPQPFNFFKKVYDHIISKNFGFVALASYEKRIIAAAIFFNFGEKAIYKYSASEGKYQHLGSNNLILWEIINWYSKSGYQTLCFGRTDPGNEGLRRFKNGWGTEESVLPYYKYDSKKESFITGHSRMKELHKKIFNNLPIPFLKITGALLYKHMG